jgi:hypothetical protein
MTYPNIQMTSGGASLMPGVSAINISSSVQTQLSLHASVFNFNRGECAQISPFSSNSLGLQVSPLVANLTGSLTTVGVGTPAGTGRIFSSMASCQAGSGGNVTVPFQLLPDGTGPTFFIGGNYQFDVQISGAAMTNSFSFSELQPVFSFVDAMTNLPLTEMGLNVCTPVRLRSRTFAGLPYDFGTPPVNLAVTSANMLFSSISNCLSLSSAINVNTSGTLSNSFYVLSQNSGPSPVDVFNAMAMPATTGIGSSIDMIPMYPIVIKPQHTLISGSCYSEEALFTVNGNVLSGVYVTGLLATTNGASVAAYSLSSSTCTSGALGVNPTFGAVLTNGGYVPVFEWQSLSGDLSGILLKYPWASTFTGATAAVGVP